MSNFGFSCLRVVNPYEVAFREARSAVGALDVLAQAEEHTTVADAIADCGLVIGTTAVGHREIQHPLKSLKEAGEIIGSRTCRVGLLFGSEKTGLSNQDLNYCHWLLHIPTCEENASMNLGQAVAVCLYELIRQSGSVMAQQEIDPADARELERVTSVFTEALYATGYMKSEGLPSTEEKVRRLIRRLDLSSADAELLLGMLRQISRKH
jgi:TrmH family RNA methyltransferase